MRAREGGGGGSGEKNKDATKKHHILHLLLVPARSATLSRIFGAESWARPLRFIFVRNYEIPGFWT